MSPPRSSIRFSATAPLGACRPSGPPGSIRSLPPDPILRGPVRPTQKDMAMNRLRQIFPAPLLALIAGLIVAAIALILLIGGVWLAALGGSAYYLVTGIAMLAAGLLLMRGRMLGGWIYIAVVFFTLLRSEEHTSELQSLMRISYAVFRLKKKI